MVKAVKGSNVSNLNAYSDAPQMLREIADDLEKGEIGPNVAVVFEEEEDIIIGWYGPQQDKTAVAECHLILNKAAAFLLNCK